MSFPQPTLACLNPNGRASPWQVLSNAQDSPRTRLVLIDDDADSRELFAEYLRMEGFDVVEYESAEDALGAVEKDRPALILTDVTLNGMSGCEAAEVLRSNLSTRDIPLIAVTGLYAQDLRGDQQLFDSVVVKPVEAEKLVATVRSILLRRSKA